MEEEDKIRYETLFYCQRLEDGFLSGDVARALFIRSKLPLPDLTKIWKLSDVSHDNKLDVFEFSIAMHLIEQKLCDQEIPKQLDSSVFANRTKEVIIPVMVKTEKNQLEKVFEQKDTNSQGYLERDVVQPLLLASRLSPSVLSKIWNIADLNRDGRLSFLEFAIALHLVKHCMKGVSLNGPVNPFLCIPEKENAIILYKEKLRIFDKEFLLEQKKRGTGETFSNSCQLNDFDLDLLAEYLADTVPLNKGEKEIDHVDETSCHNVSHVQSQEAEFEFGSVDISSKVKLCCEPTDNIECHRLTGNEINFDLEDIFQTVEKEKGNDFNEGLRYIAVRPVQSDIFSAVGDGMEDDDKVVDDVLPVPQKRTYFGKQLIFEDPIGSEIIGDVEFEVDFDAVIMDIEKECVDEERRLPIARVLPIYKSLPAANEEPFEKKTATKGTREIDLNFISDYNMNNERFNGLDKNGRDESPKLDKIIISNSVIDRITSGPQDGGANEKKNKILFKESPGNDMITGNNSKEVKDTKNTMKSREDDTLIDIVEQKRMIMQNQLEERKKLREKERNERLTVTQKSFPKEVSQKKEYGREMTKNTAHVEESKETAKLNVGAKTFNHKMNEPNTEEEEKRREAEQREKLLLERITFLERKRQIILEKKLEKAKNANMANTKSIDLWSQDSGKPPKESSEEEKKRLALALEIKRKNEAEMEKHREIELREAEKRRLEQMAKEEEERKGAEERKRTFLENLAKLKQRVVTEEAMKSGLSNTTKSRSLKRGCFSTKDMLKGRADTQLSAKQHEFMKEINGNNTSFNHAEKQPADEIKKLQPVRQTDRAEELRRKEEDEIRRENFKSNRELFIKKVENEQEANAESSSREKIKKTRPKSYYGGMFNRSVHQIIDDTLLTRDESVNIENAPDFVDEEALAQCRREKEFRKEHERVSTHQRNLDRDASYTIENVEKLWEIDSGNVPQNGKKISDSSPKKGKTSSNPNRRSLVNTLTTEWNSFLEILEINDRKESETVKMRQEISAQRKKSTQGREKHAEIKHEVAKDTKCNSSKEIIQYHVSSTKSEQPDVESDLEKIDRNSGKVKKMVNSYKRSLSATYLLQQDVLRSPCTEPEKSDEDIQNESHDVHQTKQAPRERIVHVKTNSRVHAQLREHEPLKCDNVNEIKRQQQKDIVKDNIPRRKSDLAHLWSDVVSHQ